MDSLPRTIRSTSKLDADQQEDSAKRQISTLRWRGSFMRAKKLMHAHQLQGSRRLMIRLSWYKNAQLANIDDGHKHNDIKR